MSIFPAKPLKTSAGTLVFSPEDRAQPRRELSLAALEAWEFYNQEGESHQLSEAKGWLGVAAGTLDWLVKKVSGEGNQTMFHDQADRWSRERSLVSSIKGKILRNEAETIREALRQIQSQGSAELIERAAFYLSPEYRHYKGEPLGLLIDYASQRTPDPELAKQLLRRTFELEYGSNAQQTALRIYGLVKSHSPEADLQASSAQHLAALQGQSSFIRATEKFIFSSSPESTAVTVGSMSLAVASGVRVAAGATNIFKILGIAGKAAGGLGKGVGFFAEGNVLWGINTIQASALQDPARVFNKEYLGKSYKANFVMLGVTKGISNLGLWMAAPIIKRWGLAAGDQLTAGGQALLGGVNHVTGMTGMMASTQLNQTLGYQEKAVGGTNETLVHDIFGYGTMALGHRFINGASKGKLDHWVHPTTANIPNSDFSFKSFFKDLVLRNPLTWMALGAEGGGIGKKPRRARLAKESTPVYPAFKELLQEFRQNPNSTERRLVIADKLQEAGNSQGETMMLYHHWSAEMEPAQKEILEVQLQEKQQAFEAAARKEIQKSGLNPKRVSFEWYEGYIAEVQLYRTVTAKQLDTIFSSKAGTLLRSLKQEEGSNKSLQVIVASPHLRNLTSLDLSEKGVGKILGVGNLIGEAGARALAESPHLRSLRSLSLRSYRIGAEGARALAESLHLHNLTGLNLGYNRIYSEGARAIAGSPHLRNLTNLNLDANLIGLEGIRALAESPHLQNLTGLNLGYNRIYSEAARAIAGSPHFRNLTNLNLDANLIGLEGVRALAESPHLRNLKSLNLGSNGLGPEAVRALAESPHIRNLTNLELGFNQIGDEVVRAGLRELPYFKRIRDLQL